MHTATKTSTASSRAKEFASNGLVSKIEILTEPEMVVYQQAFDQLEAETGKKASQNGLVDLHLRNARVWELVIHPKALIAVSEILGPNLVLLGTHFFCKYPEMSESFVSWHQDVTYWGLTPSKAVTLWLSIDGADIANGCMRMIPGSHHAGQLPHGKSEVAGNLLSVNQEISPSLIDDSLAVNIELPAGSASLHDGLTIHGSNPNRSSRRRCGLTMRFTSTDVKPSNAPGTWKWNPLLVQGEDYYGNFDYRERPQFAE